MILGPGVRWPINIFSCHHETHIPVRGNEHRKEQTVNKIVMIENTMKETNKEMSQ